MLDSLLKRFEHGDRLALSRLLSQVSQGHGISEIVSHLKQAATPSRVVAFTGSAGVGKSTLVGRLIDLARRENHRVAILACDPQSPLSGGALLGDRFRMPTQVDDDGVFIRSLAAAHGALAEHLEPMIRLLEAFGFDTILIETVGAGQGDTAVMELADATVVLVQPEAGDDLQWEKAGLLEIADIVVVNKGDLPKADYVEGQVRAMLGLTDGRDVPVIRVSAKTGEGLDKLWQLIQSSPKRRRQDTSAADLLRMAQEALGSWFVRALAEKRVEVLQLIERWDRHDLPPHEVVARLFELAHNELLSEAIESRN
jgi:LAO/AO transport system ATPase